MIELIKDPWPWYVAGPLIGFVVPFIYWYGGKKWGVSSALQHLCAAVLPSGIEYFRYDWRARGGWHLAMAGGMMAGGFVGWRVLSRPDLLRTAWRDEVADEHAVEMTVARLRTALGPAGVVVQTVVKRGYRLAAADA